MKPPKFHVGQLVVCVYDCFKRRKDITYPKKGQVYTIKAIAHDGMRYGFTFTELLNREVRYPFGKMEFHFRASYFAPVEQMPDEIIAELLEESLSPVTA